MKRRHFLWIAVSALVSPMGEAAAFAGESWHQYFRYPAESLRAREHGRVDFELVVGADGRPTECTIIGSSGHPTLDVSTCRQALAFARFTPTGVTFHVADHVDWAVP